MLLPPRPQQYFCKLILLSAFGRFTFIFDVATAWFGFAGIKAVRSPVELTLAEFLPLLLLASVLLGNIPDFFSIQPSSKTENGWTISSGMRGSR